MVVAERGRAGGGWVQNIHAAAMTVRVLTAIAHEIMDSKDDPVLRYETCEWRSGYPDEWPVMPRLNICIHDLNPPPACPYSTFHNHPPIQWQWQQQQQQQQTHL